MGCPGAHTPSSTTVPSLAGAVTITVTDAVGCVWSASGGSDFLAGTGLTSHDGPGSVTYAYPANPDATERVAHVTVAGHTGSSITTSTRLAR